MKIRFNLDYDLPLKKIELHKVLIAVSSVFKNDNKYYPQIVLDEYLYKLAQ